MKFLTLIEIEIKKMIPWLATLFIGLTAISTAMFYRSIGNYKDQMLPEIMNTSVTEYVQEYGKLSLNQVFDGTAFLPLSYIFAALLLVCVAFYLWYKEWFGASKRIYTLLSIKGSRLRIFFSKLTVFLLIFVSYYGLILLNLYIGGIMMGYVLPDNTVADNLVQNALLYSMFIPYAIPVSLNSLVFNLAFIVMMFAILSVFVLLDRSKKVWGMIGGLIYVIGSIVLFFYINIGLYLFTTERVQINWAFVGVFLVGSTLISYYLLKKKVSI